MIDSNFVSLIESIKFDFNIKRIEKLKTKFEQLKLINKKKLRTQISFVFVILTKKQKEIEKIRRKLRFSFDSIDDFSTFEIMNNSLLQQLNQI